LAPLQSVFPSESIFGGVGLLLATISGVGIAFIGDRIKGRVDRLETIESLGRTLSLDAIPLVSRRAQRGRSLPDYMLDTPTGAFADAMRALRGDIMNAMPAGGSGANQSHVIAVSSALPGEGKTTVAVVMARSLAAIGARVLLIDCDLRRPQIAQLLKISSEKRAGIVQVLQGQASIEAMIADDPRSSLKVLSADQHVKAPQDLLGSESFKSVIGVARKQYGFVIIDTPPEGAVSDVHLVTPHVDSTLLVVRWRSTPLRAVVLAMTAFEKRSVVLGGILLNGVDFAEAARVSGRYNLYRAARAYYAKLVQ
jgi:succinoglycan biosynthesis transport protein ExoP